MVLTDLPGRMGGPTAESKAPNSGPSPSTSLMVVGFFGDAGASFLPPSLGMLFLGPGPQSPESVSRWVGSPSPLQHQGLVSAVPLCPPLHAQA